MDSGTGTLYCSCTPVVDARYQPGGSATPAEVIIDAVADAANVEPLELPLLYEFIDPDALNTLFQKREGGVDSEAVLRFRINNWNVFVCSNGRIRVCDATQSINPEPVFDPNVV